MSLKEIFSDRDFTNSIIFCNGERVDENYVAKENDLISLRFMVGVVETLTTIGLIWMGNKIHEMSEKLKDAIPTDDESLDGEDVPSINGAKNSSQLGKPFALPLGVHRFSPFYNGSAYTSISGTYGEKEEYTLLLNCGYNDSDVSDIRMGSFDLAKNTDLIKNGYLPVTGETFKQFEDNIKVELQSGKNPNRADSEVELYPQKIVEETENTEIQHVKDYEPLSLTRFSATHPQKVQVQIKFNGLIGEKEDESATVQLKLEMSFDGGTTWVRFNDDGFGTLNDGDNHISYDIDTGISTFTMRRKDAMRFTATRQLLYSEVYGQDGTCKLPNNRVQIRITRENKKSEKQQRDIPLLTTVRTWCNDGVKTLLTKRFEPLRPVDEKRRDMTTRLAVRFQTETTGIMNKLIKEINVIVKTKTYVWNRTSQEWDFSKKVVTNNPSALALMVMTHDMLGDNGKVPLSRIDLLRFGKFYEFCEDKGLSCNGVLTQQKPMREIIDLILATGRASRITSGNLYSVFFDCKKEDKTPVHVLNNHNILNDGLQNTKDFDVIPDAYKIKFIDETNGYSESERFINFSGRDETEKGFIVETKQYVWQTDPAQIYKNAFYDYNKRITRPETWVRKLGFDSKLFEIGDLVSIQDDTLSVGIGDGGEIVKVTRNAEGYVTSAQIDINYEIVDDTQTYGVKISHYGEDGSHSVRTYEIVNRGIGIFNDFILDSPVLGNDIDVGDNVSFGVLNHETTDCLCIGKSNDNGTCLCTFVPYSDDTYYEGRVPVYVSNVTNLQSVGSNDSDSVSVSDFTNYQNLQMQKDSSIIEEAKNYTDSVIERSAILDVVSYYSSGVDGTSIPSGYESAPNDKWTVEIPNVSAGGYLWTCNTTIYKDGHKTYSFLSARQGENGQTAGMDTLVLSQYVIKKTPSGSYSPSTIVASRLHFDENGNNVVIPAIFKLYVNGYYKETQVTTDEKLETSFNYEQYLERGETLTMVKIEMYESQAVARDIERFITQYALPVVSDGENYTFGLKNQFQQYICDVDGNVQKHELKTSAFIFKGFDEITDWEFYDLPYDEARRNGFELSLNGQEITIKSIVGKTMPDSGSLRFPLFVHTTADIRNVVGNPYTGTIIGNNGKGFVLGRVAPSETTNVFSVYFSWQKTTIDKRVVANSTPKGVGVVTSISDFPSDAEYGDYVLYVGDDIGDFKKLHCYQWDGLNWVHDTNNIHITSYLSDALEYLEENDSESDSYKFIDNLFANQITARKIGTQHLTLSEGGIIDCVAKDKDGNPMIMLKDTGEAYFRRAIINGYPRSEDVFVEGTTEIDGGKIKTNSIQAESINVDNLFAQDINATGNIKATNMKLSGNSEVEGKVRANQFEIYIKGEPNSRYPFISVTNQYSEEYGTATKVNSKIRRGFRCVASGKIAITFDASVGATSSNISGVLSIVRLPAGVATYEDIIFKRTLTNITTTTNVALPYWTMTVDVGDLIYISAEFTGTTQHSDFRSVSYGFQAFTDVATYKTLTALTRFGDI